MMAKVHLLPVCCSDERRDVRCGSGDLGTTNLQWDEMGVPQVDHLQGPRSDGAYLPKVPASPTSSRRSPTAGGCSASNFSRSDGSSYNKGENEWKRMGECIKQRMGMNGSGWGNAWENDCNCRCRRLVAGCPGETQHVNAGQSRRSVVLRHHVMFQVKNLSKMFNNTN